MQIESLTLGKGLGRWLAQFGSVHLRALELEGWPEFGEHEDDLRRFAPNLASLIIQGELHCLRVLTACSSHVWYNLAACTCAR